MEPDRADEGRVVSVGWGWGCVYYRCGQVSSGDGPSCTALSDHRAPCVVAAASDGCKWWRTEVNMSSDPPSILTTLPEISVYIYAAFFFPWLFCFLFFGVVFFLISKSRLISPHPLRLAGHPRAVSHCGVLRLEAWEEEGAGKRCGLRELKDSLPSSVPACHSHWSLLGVYMDKESLGS